MQKKRALSASRAPYTFYENQPEANTIVFRAGSNDSDGELLKITKTGFYVRGVAVEQDDKEAEIVYNAFKEWMVYSALTRNYQ